MKTALYYTMFDNQFHWWHLAQLVKKRFTLHALDDNFSGTQVQIPNS